MELSEFKVLVKGLKSVYTGANFLPDENSVKIWFALLKDLDYELASAGIQKYMLTNKFPPTVADIREMSAEIVTGEIPDWSEGWKKVITSIQRYGMYQEAEALASFDPLTRQATERLGYRRICLSEDMNMDRANFRKIYEAIAEREKKNAQLPVDFALKIEAIRNEQLKIGEKDDNQN